VYNDNKLDYDEELDYDYDEEEDEEEEEYEIYDFVEEVERSGNVFDIKISAIDICCPIVLRLTVEQSLKLIRELAKKMNKDEVKQLMSMLIDIISK
jgi:hypothetical protein